MHPAATVSIKRTTRPGRSGSSSPNIPYERIARAVLGSRFELSIVICGDALAQRMNATYRKKTYSPNVLSFPLSRSEGEIFLNVRKAEREAKQLKMALRERMALLFVHGCYHLKGLRHGRIMENAEQQILRRFHLTAKRA